MSEVDDLRLNLSFAIYMSNMDHLLYFIGIISCIV
jgi:hypothetical protein